MRPVPVFFILFAVTQNFRNLPVSQTYTIRTTVVQCRRRRTLRGAPRNSQRTLVGKGGEGHTPSFPLQGPSDDFTIPHPSKRLVCHYRTGRCVGVRDAEDGGSTPTHTPHLQNSGVYPHTTCLAKNNRRQKGSRGQWQETSFYFCLTNLRSRTSSNCTPPSLLPSLPEAITLAMAAGVSSPASLAASLSI